MNVTDSQVSCTLSVFGQLPFDVVEESWFNAAWDNRYTDIILPDVDLLKSFEGNGSRLLEALSNACDVCQKWSRFCGTDVDVGKEDSDDKLWRTLMANGVNQKALLGLIYLGIGQGSSSGATLVKKKIALRFSKLYFNLMLVPGTSVFHESLFQSAIQCVCLPSKNTLLNKDGTRNASQSGSTPGSGGRQKQFATATASKDADTDESTTVESETISESMLLDFITCMTDSLKDLVRALHSFSLLSYSEVTEFLIQHLCELAQLDIPGADVCFNVGLEQQLRGCHYRQLTSYVYCTLKLLCLPQHGEPANNFRVIAKSLMPHILMLAAGDTQTVALPFTKVRDNSVAFFCHVMQSCGDSTRESFQDVALILIHNVAFHAVNRTDFRQKTTHAVLMIMGELNEERFKRIVQWFIKLTMVPLAKRRIFALEMILALIWNERVADKRPDLLLAAMKRCYDKVVLVKNKALSVLESVTNEEPERWMPLLEVSNPVEPEGEGEGAQVAVEDDRLSQLMEVLKYRAEDSRAYVRKAVVAVLQNVVCASHAFIKEEYVEIMKESCLDLALLVRMQALLALTKCLRAHPEEELLLRHWLEGALPLVLDAENSVMEKAAEAFEELILGPLCLLEPAGPDADLAWRLLAQVSQGPFREHHKYLHQAVLLLHRAEKLRPDKLKVLKTYVGGPNDASVWLLLSKLSLYCDLGQGDFAYSYLKQQWQDQPQGSNNPRASNETINHVLIVLKKVSRHLPSNALEELIADLEQRLSQLSLPVEVIASTVNCLQILKVNVHRDMPKLGEHAIQVWCKQMLDKCETFLHQAVMGAKDEDSKLLEEQLVRHLVLLGEASQLAPRAVSSQLYDLVQACMTSSESPEATFEPVTMKDAVVSEPDAKRGDIKRKLTRRSRAQQSGGGKSCLRTNPRVRAHAVIVMGMLCIQNEMLAKTVVPTMGNSLSCSQDPMMRANLIIVLTDMCKRYGVLVDPYLPVVTRYIKDSVPAIRSLVLTCLFQLLEQGFLKLRGRLFYRLLSALTDDEREIRELAEFGLVHCVLKQNMHVFYHRFVECLFYFNSYRGSSGKSSQENVVEVTQRDRRLFSLEGEGRRDQRMALYRFMLLHLLDEDRFKLTLALTHSVLMPCANKTNTGLGMEEECPELLHDALSVMGSEEIQLETIAALAADVATEEDPARALMHTARETLLKNVVIKNVLENVIPLVIALKNKLEAAQSPLLQSLLMFLRDLMRDYKVQVDDVLSADETLASEIAFDVRHLEREGEEEAAAKGRAIATPKTYACSVNPELRELLETARMLKEEALKRRYIVALPQVTSEEETTQQQNGNVEPTPQAHTASTRAAESGVEKISEEPAADQSTSKHTPSNAWLINQASSSSSLESASSKGGSRASPSGRPMDPSRNPAAPAASKTASEVMPQSRSNSCTNSTARKELVMDVADSQVQEHAKGVSMEEAAPDSPQTGCSSLSDFSALFIKDTTGEFQKIRKKSCTRIPPLGVPIPGRPQSPKLPIELGETDLVQSSPLQNLATSLADTPAHSKTDAGEIRKAEDTG